MTAPPSSEAEASDPVRVLIGVGSVCLGHALLVLLVMIATTLGLSVDGSILVIGGMQLLYVGPMMVLSWRRGARSYFWSVVGTAAITLLLNGGCWGLVIYSFDGVH